MFDGVAVHYQLELMMIEQTTLIEYWYGKEEALDAWKRKEVWADTFGYDAELTRFEYTRKISLIRILDADEAISNCVRR